MNFSCSLLTLDMVVRDEYGNPLDPLSASTIHLFRQHQRSSQQLKKNVVFILKITTFILKKASVIWTFSFLFANSARVQPG